MHKEIMNKPKKISIQIYKFDMCVYLLTGRIDIGFSEIKLLHYRYQSPTCTKVSHKI